MPRRIINGLVMVLLSCGTLAAQTRPDFSGTWVLDVARSDKEPLTPVTLVIAQSPASLTIERQLEGQSDRVTYSFDEPRTPVAPEAVGPAAESETVLEKATAEWEGNRLKTYNVVRINGKAVTQDTTRTLNPGGTEMTVLTALQVQHGYQAGEAHSSAKYVYVKARE